MTRKGVLCLGESLLRHNTTLRSLNLRGNIFEKGENVVGIGECFGANSHLTNLGFGYCDLGGENMCDLLRGLLKNTYFHTLNLSYNPIKDKPVNQIGEYVGRNDNLVKLDLNSSQIGSEGAICLGKGLAKSTSLLHLDLSHNSIEEEGGKAMAEMIESNVSLRVLHLFCCAIDGNGIERICKSLCGNTTLVILNIDYNSLPSSKEMAEKCVENVSKNKYLIRLNFDGFDEDFNDNIWRIMKRNKIFWKERMHWSCILNVLCRVMMLGEWNCAFPSEMIREILWNVAPHDSLSEGEKKRVMNHAFDKSTIGGEKQTFLECIFGKGMNRLLKQLKKQS